MSSFTKQQQRTLIFIGGFVLAIGLSGWLMVDLNAKRTQVTRLTTDVQRKESDAQNLRLPTEEEQAKWSEHANKQAGVLLSDQEEPQFLEELSSIATQNGLRGVGYSTEQHVIEPEKIPPTPEEVKVLAVGIRRYLTVTVKFTGQYPDVARFLGSVSKLQRPIEYKSIDLKRLHPFIDVQLVMNVYKREPA